MIGCFILIFIHILVIAGGIAVTLLLPAKITTSIVISLVFCVIAYLAFAATTIFTAIQSRQKGMQNGGMITASLIYFLVALIGSLILTALHVSVKIHILLEVVILIFGIVFMLLMLMAKLHIEGQ